MYNIFPQLINHQQKDIFKSLKEASKTNKNFTFT